MTLCMLFVILEETSKHYFLHATFFPLRIAKNREALSFSTYHLFFEFKSMLKQTLTIILASFIFFDYCRHHHLHHLIHQLYFNSLYFQYIGII
jgi:hypothetical protein